MRRATLPVGVYITLVFLSGLLVGAFGMRLYYVTSVSARQSLARPSAEEFRRKMMVDMQRRLSLSQEQVANINKALDDTRAQFKRIHEKIEPEMKELKEQQTAKIRALLTPEQQPEYDRWRAEREKSGK